MEELERRLRGRGTESDDKVRLRLGQARNEIARAGEFEYIIINDDVERAAGDILAIIKSEKLRASRNKTVVKEFE